MRATVVSLLLLLSGCGLALDPRVDRGGREDARVAIDAGGPLDASDDAGMTHDLDGGGENTGPDVGALADAAADDAPEPILDATVEDTGVWVARDAGPVRWDGGRDAGSPFDAGRDAGPDRPDAGRDAGNDAGLSVLEAGIEPGLPTLGQLCTPTGALCSSGTTCRPFTDPGSGCDYYMCTITCVRDDACVTAFGTTDVSCNAGFCERTGPSHGPFMC
jgi:hypothetical protein